MTNFEKIILDTFVSLERLTGVVTTLDIKNQVRNTHPTLRCYQADVSEAMINLQSDNAIPNLKYGDNGVYREYYIAKKKSVYTSKTSKISRTDMVDLLKNTSGRFFTVTWIKNNGEERSINARVSKNNFYSALGYIQMKTSKGEIKLVNPTTLKKLTTNGVTYKVKK